MCWRVGPRSCLVKDAQHAPACACCFSLSALACLRRVSRSIVSSCTRCSCERCSHIGRTAATRSAGLSVAATSRGASSFCMARSE